MEQTGETIEGIQKYWCFISYRHSDNREEDREWATWLHKEIERYEVPADLIGKRNKRGQEIPHRIYPVFRDEESLPVDADLSKSIELALNRSEFLVVICSPRAVESKYVRQEVEHFTNSDNFDRVIPAIISGEPGGGENECFPLPIRELTNERGGKIEPIAADFRLDDKTKSEGYTSAEAYEFELAKSLSRNEAREKAAKYGNRIQLMKLKIIAGILGVSLENLRDRDKAYQLELSKQRSKVLTRWLLGVSALAVAAAIMGWLAVKSYKVAEENLKVSLEEQGKSLLELANNEIDSSGKPTLPDVPMLASRAVGFVGEEVSGNFHKQYPELLDEVATPNEFKRAKELIRQGLPSVFPLFSTPSSNQHAGSIVAIGECSQNRLFSVGNGVLRIWDRSEMSLINERRFFPEIWRAKPINNGEEILAVFDDGLLKVIDSHSLEVVRKFDTTLGKVISLSVSADSSRACACSVDGELCVWDLKTGKELNRKFFELRSKLQPFATISPSGKKIAITLDGKAQILNLETEEIETLAPSDRRIGFECVDWAPDGARIAATGRSGITAIWDYVDSPNLFVEFKEPTQGFRLRFSKTGRYLLVCPRPAGGAMPPQLHDLKDGDTDVEKVKIWKDVSHVWNCDFSAGDEFLYGGTVSGKIVIAKLNGVDGSSGEFKSLVKFPGHGHGVAIARFSNNNRYLLTAERAGNLRTWDLQSGKSIYGMNPSGFSGAIREVQTVPGKEYFLALDRVGRLFKIDPEDPDSQFEIIQLENDEPTSLVVSPSGKQLAIGYSNGEIEIRSVKSPQTVYRRFTGVEKRGELARRLESSMGGQYRIVALAFDAGEQHLAWGIRAPGFTTARKFRILNIESNQIVYEAQGDPSTVHCVAYDAKSDVFAYGTENGYANFVKIGEEPQSSRTRIDGTPVTALAIDEGRNQIFIGTESGLISLFDRRTSINRFDLKASDGAVSSIGLSNDGMSICVGSERGTAKIWKIGERELGTPAAGMLLQLSERGTILTAAGNEDVIGLSRISQTNWLTGQPVESQTFRFTMEGASCSEDANIFAIVTQSQRCVVWNKNAPAEKENILRSDDEFQIASVSRSGKYIATGSGSDLSLWNSRNLDSQLWKTKLKGETPQYAALGMNLFEVEAVKFHPSEDSVAVGYTDGRIRIYRVKDGSLMSETRVERTVSSLEYDSVGNRLGITDLSGLVRVHELKNECFLNSYIDFHHETQAYRLAFGTDGRIMASMDVGGVARIWDMEDSRMIAEVKAHKDGRAVLLSRNNKNLLTAGFDGTRGWRLNPPEYSSIVMSADEQRKSFLKVSFDGKNLVWTDKCDSLRDLPGMAEIHPNHEGSHMEYLSLPEGEYDEIQFWSSCNVGNWNGAVTFFDAKNDSHKIALLEGLFEKRFAPTISRISFVLSLSAPKSDNLVSKHRFLKRSLEKSLVKLRDGDDS